MGTEQATGGISLDELEYVIDADAHVRENITDIAPYLDDGVEKFVDRSSNPSFGLFSTSKATPSRFEYGAIYGFEPDEPEHYSLENKLDEFEDFDLDYALTLTNLLSLNTVNNDQIAVGLARGYNRWLVDTYLSHEKIKGGIMVAPQRPDLAAEEIDTWADHDDMVAAGVPASGLTHLPGHYSYDPIYEAARDNDLPVVFHPSSGAMAMDFPNLYRRCQTETIQHMMGHPFSNMACFTSLMFEGTPAKFPEVNFVFQEAGLGWGPFMKLRLDDHYLERAEEIPYLTKLPSEYMQEQFSFTTQPLGHTEQNQQQIAWLVDMVGSESVMYSADLPHVDFDPPNELFDRIKSYFDRDDLNNIMGGNAARVFGL